LAGAIVDFERDEGNGHAKGFDTYGGFTFEFSAMWGTGGESIENRVEGWYDRICWDPRLGQWEAGSHIYRSRRVVNASQCHRTRRWYRTVKMILRKEMVRTGSTLLDGEDAIEAGQRASYRTVDTLPDSEDATHPHRKNVEVRARDDVPTFSCHGHDRTSSSASTITNKPRPAVDPIFMSLVYEIPLSAPQTPHPWLLPSLFRRHDVRHGCGNCTSPLNSHGHRRAISVTEDPPCKIRGAMGD